MKYFISILIFIFLCSCSTKQLLLVKSTSQNWSTIDKSTSGTNYYFLVKTFTDKNKIKIDSLCIYNNLIKDFKYSVIGKSNENKDFNKGDTILISVNKIENKSEKNVICNCKKKIVSSIYYSNNNKKFILKVYSFKILQDLK